MTLLLAGASAYVVLAWRLRHALEEGPGGRGAMSFSPLPSPAFQPERWGGGEVQAVSVTPTSLITAGGFGILDESGDIGRALPSLKVSASALWRGRLVVGLVSGGLFLRRDNGWEEARTGFGLLHVRTLVEVEGGELLIGAQEGLFRVAWGAASLERLDKAPVRSVALGPSGLLLAGGEEGLRRIEGAHAQLLPTPDPWVDFVGVRDKEVVVSTPMGLAAGPLGGALLPLAGGQDVTSACVLGNQVFAVAEGRLLRFEPSGKAAEEFLPSPPRQVFAPTGTLFADTANGLYRKSREGWTLIRQRPPSLPPGPCHVTALASLNGRVVLGLFDGGLATGEAHAGSLAFTPVAGSATWGVNALLPAGGSMAVASLRGTARYDGNRVDAMPVAGGGAFSLALAPDGLAIGTGQGVLLPDGRFLSAFHGLPGNQALALAALGEDLFVGTPSGLGAIRGARVQWRTVTGDGKLPHPWVTALAVHHGALYVGTYGGGVTCRTPLKGQENTPGVFTSFPETGGMKVNAGCLVAAGGQLFLGTDGKGLYRLSSDGSRFVSCAVPLPSRRITALLGDGDWLCIGTDEGFTRLPLSILREGA